MLHDIYWVTTGRQCNGHGGVWAIWVRLLLFLIDFFCSCGKLLATCQYLSARKDICIVSYRNRALVRAGDRCRWFNRSCDSRLWYHLPTKHVSSRPALNYINAVNPLMSTGNYSATSNIMKLVHGPLMGRLLHLVQRGGSLAGPQPAQTSRSTKGNSRPNVPITV